MSERVKGMPAVLLPAAVMVLLGFVGATAARAQTAAADAVARKIPFNRTLPTPCAEKRIRLTGEFQARYNVTRNAGGDTFVEGNIDADRISGLGLTSRGRYVANGASRLESRGPAPIRFTYVFNFALNKEGTTDSLMGHVKFRIIVQPRGGVTTNVISANVDCAK